MGEILYWIAYFISTFFELYMISQCMEMFLGDDGNPKLYTLGAYILRLVICTVQYTLFPYPLLNTAVGLLTLIIISICYGGTHIKKLVVSVIILMSLFTAEAVLAGIVAIANVDIESQGNTGGAFVCVGISIVLALIYETIRAFKNIDKEFNLTVEFGAVILLLCVIIFILETTIFKQQHIDNSVKILSVVCMLIVLFIIIFLYDTISKNYKEKMRSKIFELEKNYYYRQAEMLQVKNKELSEFRHDINNHLYSLAGMAGDNNPEIKQYIERITNRLQKTVMFSDTGNIAIDSILNYKLSVAKDNNVKIFTNISVPVHIVSDTEIIVTILSNLLDNAIEAGKKIDNPYIKIKIIYLKGLLSIEVINNYNGMVNTKKGKVVTSKQNKEFHGIGLQNVEIAINENNGYLNINYDEKEFKVEAYLYVETEKL